MSRYPRAALLPAALACVFLFLSAIGFAADPAPAELTAEQKAAMATLDALLVRFDDLLAKVEDVRVRTDTAAVLDGLKKQRDELRQKFDPGRYDELKLDVNTESQRVALWLRPLRTPPRGSR